MTKKCKILTISDHPLSPSGVGTQTKYIIESLLKTGKYEVISLGGAMKQQSYEPIKPEGWADDWIIYPVDGYGEQEMVRSILRAHKPDILWFMTDPRFWGWLWHIEHEIRSLVPMVYYHVWDNYPYPTFNKHFYDSNDTIVCISKVTDDIVKTVSPDVESFYVPHSVNTDVFKKYPQEEVAEFRNNYLYKNDHVENKDKFVVFWNNRNARRKQSGSLIYWFKEFLDKVGHENACLLMHTGVKDPHGQDLEAIITGLGLTNGEVMFSTAKYPPETLALMYNIADCTINIADAEGFGLATLESLACETPIIVTMTGGLQEQVTDGEKWFGIGLEPTSKAIIGSQDIPWIYEDRLSKEVVVEALEEMYNKTKKERKDLGRQGRKHVMKNYNFENYGKKWDEILSHVHEECGSWEERKNYNSWELKEVV
mgnify:CR=1 FL=1